nr:hypothetical protein [Tanacetum cinerariifolium]
MEQHLALTHGNQAPGVVKSEFKGNVNFEIKSQFMRELREDTFSGNKNDDAYEHVERILAIMGGQTISRNNHHLGFAQKGLYLRYCSPFKTPKQLEEIHNFKQEGDETLYQAWKRYNDLLYKCPTHNLNSHQKVNIFYKGLDTMTHQLLDSQRPIANKTPAQALDANQTMADHSQKWHNGSTRRKISNDGSDGISSITSKLDSLGRISCRSTRILREKKPSLEELMNKHLKESTRRRAKMKEWMKKLQESTYLNTRNQKASLKSLKTQYEQLAKDYQAKAANKVPNSSIGQCNAYFANNEAPTDETNSNGTNELYGFSYF